MIGWLLALLACSQQPTTKLPPHAHPCQAQGTDVVIISIDTTRADHLGFSGHKTANTPNIDALAARGLVFSNAIAPIPRTTPALASLMTGLAPHHHGSREVGEKMTAPDTLATMLTGAGWRALGISAMPVAGPEQNMDRGFDHFEVDFDAPAEKLTKRVLNRVGEVDPSCPLFVWAHFSDPHFPYAPPPAFKPAGDTERCDKIVAQATAGKLSRYRYFEDRDGRSSDILAQCKLLYDGEIAAVDHSVGVLLAGLVAMGRTDPIVIVTADHGENLGEWGLFFEHGPNAHDASTRVPLVLTGPSITPGSTDAVVSLEDITPTVLALTGVAAPKTLHFDGQSLLSPIPARRTVVKGESGSALHARLGGFLVAGRSDSLHCLHGKRFSLCDHPKKPRRLFDRSADPDLLRDVSASQPAKRKALAAAWAAWPAERTRQRFVRTQTHLLVATPRLEGGYQNALYDHQADKALSTDLSASLPEVMAELTPKLAAWHTELDQANVDVSQRNQDQEDALRTLGYIE